MVVNWNDAADARLFAAVIATSDLKLDYNKIAAIMGPECTAKAVTHRISKVREIAKSFDTSLLSPQTATPGKRGRKPKVKVAKSDNDDAEEEESPTKKRKTTTSKKAGKVEPEPEVKEEDGEDGGVAVEEEEKFNEEV